MSATRCFSCIAFPFPRVVLGSKNIQVAKIFGPAKPLLSRCQESAIASPCNKPGRATTPVPAASCRTFSASVLTSYIEGQCRQLLYCNTHFKNLAYRKLGDRLPLFTELPRRLILGNWVSGNGDSRKPVFTRWSQPYAEFRHQSRRSLQNSASGGIGSTSAPTRTRNMRVLVR